MKQSFSSYRDPELTRAGQEKAVQRGALFRTYLSENGFQNPIVGASLLMRAQQTAFLMMSPDYDAQEYLKTLFVVPFVSETGPRFWFQTDDNKPMTDESQKRQVLSLPGKKPSLTTVLRPVPNPLPSKSEIPDIKKFKGWLAQYYTTLRQIVQQEVPRFTEEHQEQYEELENANQRLAGRIAGLRANAATPFGLRSEARRARLQRERNTLRTRRNALNRLRALADTGLASSTPFVLFTHGNFIAEFIKDVTRGHVKIAKDDRPNYSAFEFQVTLVPNQPPTIQYRGPVAYDNGADADPESPYTSTSAIDPAEECAEGGDRCRISACTRRSANVYVRTRRQRPAAPVAPFAPAPPAPLRLNLAVKPKTPYPLRQETSLGNVQYYGDNNDANANNAQQGGSKRRHTRKHRVHFHRKTHKRTIR